jgi:hypothetical protein
MAHSDAKPRRLMNQMWGYFAWVGLCASEKSEKAHRDSRPFHPQEETRHLNRSLQNLAHQMAR